MMLLLIDLINLINSYIKFKSSNSKINLISSRGFNNIYSIYIKYKLKI